MLNIFLNMGYEVLLTANGLGALEIFNKKYNHINIVFMDLNMPIMNEFEKD